MLLLLLLSFFFNKIIAQNESAADILSHELNFDADKNLKKEEEFLEQEGIKYIVKYNGNIKQNIMHMIKEASIMLEYQLRPPATKRVLEERINKELKIIKSIFVSFGYFDVDIEYKVTYKNKIANIVFDIKKGTNYLIKDVEVRDFKDDTIITMPQDLDLILNLAKNTSIDSEKISNAQEILKKHFLKIGYAFAQIKKVDATIDKEEKTVIIIYRAILNKKSIIVANEILITGDLNKEFIENRLLWKIDDVFSIKKIEDTKKNLIQTSIFSGINITPIEIDDNNNSNQKDESLAPVKMKIEIQNAPKNALNLGLRYATSMGPQLNAGWNNYNLSGKGDNLGVNIKFSKIKKKIGSHYSIPDVIGKNQYLKNHIFAEKENTRAYDLKNFSIGSKSEHNINDLISVSFGITHEKGYVIDQTNFQKTPVELIGFPLELIFDASNDLLNPTRGFRLEGIATPYSGIIGKNKSMLITKFTFSFYLPIKTVLEDDYFCLANFIRVGSINMKNNATPPPNKRFYSGGEGSIRGYGYQLLGPVNQNRIPLGGKSLLEFGTELRARFNDKMGGVFFLEAGSVKNTDFTKFSNLKLLWSFGFGFRYYTEFTPLRFDLAFPCKRRKLSPGTKPYDSIFQFYVSAGQAF